MFRTYYSLIKPGMIRGNAIITAAGFLLASKGDINFGLLIATLIGISCVIASGCVLNNYLDRDIDAKMQRTKNRAFPKKEVSGSSAILFAIILGILGIFILAMFTNFLVVLLAFVGAIVYVGCYTPLKHTTEHAAIIGSIAGAVPIVVGYCAVTNRFDIGALILFLMLVLWQMPHFFAISIYRYDEYKAAGVPVFPVKRGIAYTKILILVYIVLFMIATLLLTLKGYAGHTYALIATGLCIGWIFLSFKGFKKNRDTRRWARQMFIFSLVVIMTLSVTFALNSLLS